MLNTTPFYTAIVKDYTNPHFCESSTWAESVLKHNELWLGPARVITAMSDSYLAMASAAHAAYGESVTNHWRFATLCNYVAMLEFLDSDDTELLWIEADMVKHPDVVLPVKYGVCFIAAWDNPNYTPTKYERYKREFCERVLPSPVRPYSCMQSSWLRLARETVTTLIANLHNAGLDLRTKEAWLKVQAVEQNMGYNSVQFFCDMVLELAWKAGPWQADNVFDLLGWIDYHPDWATKPILHFSGDRKPEAAAWVANYGN